jgi:hypothetical protein
METKPIERHVAELDALVADTTLEDLIATSRDAVDLRIQLARTEVELNVWRSTT